MSFILQISMSLKRIESWVGTSHFVFRSENLRGTPQRRYLGTKRKKRLAIKAHLIPVLSLATYIICLPSIHQYRIYNMTTLNRECTHYSLQSHALNCYLCLSLWNLHQYSSVKWYSLNKQNCLFQKRVSLV
jgi:hypothetical protein